MEYFPLLINNFQLSNNLAIDKILSQEMKKGQGDRKDKIENERWNSSALSS